MSADKFIAELKGRRLVSDRLIGKLREKLAESDRPLSARAVAKFLVQKKHLSQRHAGEVLDAMMARGDDVDIAPPPQASSNSTETANNSGAAETGRTARPQPPSREEPPFSDAGDADDNDPTSSSIFAPFLTGIHKNKDRSPQPPADEIELLPVDDLPVEPAVPHDPSQLSSIEDLTDLSPSKSSDDVNPKLMSDPLVADVNLTARSSALRPGSSVKLKSAKDQTKAGRAAARSVAARSRRGDKPRVKKKSKRKNEWDSPLILVGGGALVLLVLCGAVVYWFLNWESGDEKLRLARESVNSGSYTQATQLFQDFLADHPRHPEAGLARVQFAMARIRRDTEAGRYPVALQTAQDELEAIADHKEFSAAHAELESLLPQIAEGLASEAERSANPEEVAKRTEQATTALALCTNTKYIPKSLRDETRLDVVRQTLARVERRQQSHDDLQAAIRQIEESIAAGETRAAYDAHGNILKSHPELADDKKLAELVREISAAEQAAIRYVDEEQAPETTERPVPWVASLAMAHRHAGSGDPRTTAPGADTPATPRQVGSRGAACVRVDGALYGIDVATGRLLWRRHIGFAGSDWPVMLAGGVLVADTAHSELVRIEAATGKLVWRQAIGEPFAMPLVAGKRAFVAAESGRLYVLDVASGTRMGYVEFGQPLRVPPAVDRLGERLYLTGDQFNIYSISLADLSCLGVYYLGHPQGSIQVAPAHVVNKLAVLVNDGVETSRFHLLSLDDTGAVNGEVKRERLHGLAAAAPLVAGRRLVLATDRGQMNVYEVASSNKADEAITLVAQREGAEPQPLLRHLIVAENHIWVGDHQLTKYGISPTGNALPVESTDNDFGGSTFDHPLELFGTTLVHTRRPKGRAGAVVAAMDTDQGRTLWETGLAIPPVSAPIVDGDARALTVANANGYVFRFDEAALKSRVQDEPLAADSMPANVPILTAAVDLNSGRGAFCAPGESNHIALYDPANERVRWTKLPGPLACRVTPLGEGLLAPLEMGQVFYLNPHDGQSLASPFQPRLQPRTTVEYKPAASVDSTGRQFVITDGHEKIYLVALNDDPQPHFQAVAEANVGPFPIRSPVFVLGDVALGMTTESDIVQFRLPSLETAGETDVPGDVAWGPFVAGNQLVLATADGQLIAISAQGEIAWSTPLEAADLAGPPLAVEGGILLAYRNGTLERRSTSDGKPQAKIDVRHPLAAGPVEFQGRVVLTANDGTLLVVEAP
jgi:outer membrane protein assembly factor BamB